MPPMDDPRPPGRTSPPFDPRPVTLVGRLVRLEPLGLEHVEPLAEVGLDPRIWRWMRDQPATIDDRQAFVAEALDASAAGREPFAQVDLATERPIGSTRYMTIEREQRRLEIGYTWLAPAFWGSGRNDDAKRTLLAHAFDDLGAHRVEFKTDALNERSRAALRHIGATEEGTFRRYQITTGGRVRDSAFFSVVWDEWPAVRDRLDGLIDTAMAERKE